jgi:hypothetical protein
LSVFRFTAHEVAIKIGIPIREWMCNCHGIAAAMLEKGLVQGVHRHGRYTGPFDKAVWGFERWGGKGAGHGWIELADGTVVDPTRYYFEGEPPYVYVGPADDYRVGYE